MSLLDDAALLLEDAREAYADDPDAGGLLDGLDARLHEPVRVAIAGMVKAGKSTLLNALLGEQIAPTDTAECTRVVTWYRHSSTPEVTIHLREGEVRAMPIRRDHGRLRFDLGGLSAEEIDRIDVGWPLARLNSLVVIDTPGIASLTMEATAQTTRLLADEESSADAVIYLMRHLHGADVRFLESFRDVGAGAAASVCAVGVLSRADEIGSGRIDSMLSARKVALRYEQDPALASLVLGVIPVAGLVAEGARTLKESEYIALRELSRLDRDDREALLVSADRFGQDSSATAQSAQVRRELLVRFGIFGVRLATALIRAGASSSSALSEAMVEQSGLVELQEFIRTQFHSRAHALKARGIVVELDRLLRRRPVEDAARVRAGIERIVVRAHTLRELSLLSAARAGQLPLPGPDAEEAVRLLGGAGTGAAARLGADDAAGPDELWARIEERIGYWRRRSESPLSDRVVVEVSRVVVRSLEQLASEVGAGRSDGPPADIVLARGPREGPGQEAEQQREHGQAELHPQKKLKRFAALTHRDPLG